MRVFHEKNTEVANVARRTDNLFAQFAQNQAVETGKGGLGTYLEVALDLFVDALSLFYTSLVDVSRKPAGLVVCKVRRGLVIVSSAVQVVEYIFDVIGR